MHRKNCHPDTAALSHRIWWVISCMAAATATTDDVFLEWHVKINEQIQPVLQNQSVITINDLFPGPLINASTNDNVHINVYNEMDEPLLFTWNGIQQRLNSWQDGVSGTNCPILPGTNWTYVFQMKDQIGSFFYFPSIKFQKAGGGFGPIRINNRIIINVPFPKPEQEFDLLIGDWFTDDYKVVREGGSHFLSAYLMNGKGPYGDPTAKVHESFKVSKGKTYRFRISNVGSLWSLNFRIQNHEMLLVETEGSYTNQITLNSLDVHVGQSFSVLVTADQDAEDYYIVATPKWVVNTTTPNAVAAVGILHYDTSSKNANGPLPNGPDPFNTSFSLNQALSITMNMTAGAARPNPQGAFNVTNVTLAQTFVLRGFSADLNTTFNRYTINNVAYTTPHTPLKLADQYLNGSGVYQLDAFPVHSSLPEPVNGTFVVSGTHKGWLEIVIQNDLNRVDSWHLDGYGLFVVGYGLGDWTPAARLTYNLINPIVRSTVQVYPEGWTAVYVYLDNPGMWNLRSQNLRHWYFGQELYIRIV
ncbi:hypothetical protein ACS0TY_009438 [Phlomoides rotata]